MRKDHYFCDRCKLEFESKQLKTASFRFDAHYESSFGKYYSNDVSMDLCEACSLGLGLLVKQDDGKSVNVKTESIKDRLYDIFQELMREC